jgi:hypothetical protein
MKRERNVISDCRSSCDRMMKSCEASSTDPDRCAERWEECVSECVPSE